MVYLQFLLTKFGLRQIMGRVYNPAKQNHINTSNTIIFLHWRQLYLVVSADQRPMTRTCWYPVTLRRGSTTLRFRRWEYFPFKLIYLFPSSLNSWPKQSLFRLPMTWANVPSGAKGNLVVSADDWENNQRYWDRRGAITFIFKVVINGTSVSVKGTNLNLLNRKKHEIT